MRFTRAARILRALFPALLLCAAGKGAALADPPYAHVGPTVWVSSARANLEHHEMIGDADPSDPKRLVACTITFSAVTNTRANMVYSSFDGGATWWPSFEDTLHEEGWVGDPSCAYGINGQAYYVSMTFYKGPRLTASLTAYRSDDGARTWRPAGNRVIMDRDYVLVDRTNSPMRGRVYVYGDGWGVDTDPRGHKTAALELNRLYAGNFSGTVFPSDYESYANMNPGEGAITDSGKVIMPFVGTLRNSDRWLLGICVSKNGGLSIGRSIVVDRNSSGDLPMMAVDRSAGPFHGRIYVAYTTDARDFPRNDQGYTRVAVVHSDNDGATWSSPATLHESPGAAAKSGGPAQRQPAIAVNASGVVALSWYDSRDDPEGKALKLRFAASFDGGESFASSVLVSNEPYDQRRADPYFFPTYVGSGGSYSSYHPVTDQPLETLTGPDYFVEVEPGDTRSMPADAGGAFHPFWYDNRTKILQLYTAAVTVTGRAWRHGNAALDSLQDLTRRVTLRYIATRFDPKTGALDMTARLVNRSDNTIGGPAEFRLLWSDSAAGIPRATNAANQLGGPGAIWDISHQVGREGVPPWGESRPFTLSFKIDRLDVRKLTFPALVFDTRFYGRVR